MFDLLKITIIAATVHGALAVAFVSRVDCVTHHTFDGLPVCTQWEAR